MVNAEKRRFTNRTRLLLKYRDVIYEQQERVFHRDIQTRENNGEYTSAKRECFCPLFSSVLDIPVGNELELFIWLLR